MMVLVVEVEMVTMVVVVEVEVVMVMREEVQVDGFASLPTLSRGCKKCKEMQNSLLNSDIAQIGGRGLANLVMCGIVGIF